MSTATVCRAGAFAALLLMSGRDALAQQLDNRCTISVLNRNVQVNNDGSWVLPNVPANFGPVRARVTCIINGETISGESEPFNLTPNGVINAPKIRLGQTTPIPSSVTVTAAAAVLNTVGATTQLTVTAKYPNNTTANVTAASSGTQYTVTNNLIATVSPNGLVTAVKSGTVLVQATHEGASGIVSIQVALSSSDTDGDGIPDDVEISLGLDPRNPIDALEDFDRDNLTNKQEAQLGTDIRKADTDGDGLKDGDEVTRGTGPLVRDTDGDGVSDGLEVQTGSNPLNAASLNLSAALASIAVSPKQFVLVFNTIAGEASRRLTVTGTLKDGASIDLTATSRGTNYGSSDLNICNFGALDGAVYAGSSGACKVTVTSNGFTDSAFVTVTTFSPTPLSFLNLDGVGNAVDISGDYAFVAVGTAGLEVINVANRNAPVRVTRLALTGEALDVKLVGNLAYVAARSGGLKIVNIANPAAPQLVGSVQAPADVMDVVVRGNYAYLACWQAGLQIADISNPAAPRIVGGVATVNPARGVDALGPLAVIADSSGLQVIDIQNPAAPALRGRVALPGDNSNDVVLKGSTAFVADGTGSLRVVNVSNPLAPAAIATTDPALGGYLADVTIADPFLFGADYFFVNGVPIVDITNPATPIPRAILDFRQFRDDNGAGIAVDASYVYLSTFEGRLYVGQYRLAQDVAGVAPNVSITSPAIGATFIEGQTIPITVTATDDVGVASVTLLVDGQIVGTDTTAPYQFSVIAPGGGATALTLSALAMDFGGNLKIANDISLVITPGLGRITGRAGDSVTNAALAGVTVRVYNTQGNQVTQTTTGADGQYATVGLSAGAYYVTATINGYVGGLYQNKTCIGCVPTTGTPVLVSNGSSAAAINFALARLGRIGGVVTDATTGAAIIGVVSVGVYDGANQLIQSVQTRIGSDVPGGNGYLIDALPPGTYYVRTFNSVGYVNEIAGGIKPADCCATSQGQPIVVGPGPSITTVNFSLAMGGQIRGVFTNSSTGNTLSGPWVDIYDVTGRYVMGGATNGVGQWITYGGVPAGTYFLRTKNRLGYFNEAYGGAACLGCNVITTSTPVTVTVGATTSNIDFALSSGGGQLSGRLTDAVSNQAIPSVNVDLYDATGRYLEGSFSDSNGNFIIDGGIPAGTYFARSTNSPGYVPQLYSLIDCGGCLVTDGTPITVGQGSIINNLNFKLKRGARISGRVTDTAGNGLGQTWVHVENSAGLFVTGGNTDAAGVYRTNDGLPDGTFFARTYSSLGFVNEAYQEQECPDCRASAVGTPIVIANGEPVTGIDFTLANGGHISGRVTDIATGQGIPGVQVQIYTTANPAIWAGSANTDATGAYVITSGLPTGTYFVRTWTASNYLNAIYGSVTCCDIRRGTPVTLNIGQTATGIDFALAVGGRMSGRVLDASNQPIPGVNVQFYTSTGSFVTQVTSDATGNYISESVVPGTYFSRTFNAKGFANQLYAGIACFGCTVTTGTPITVAKDVVTTDVSYTLAKGTGAYIRGRVFDAVTGQPVPSASADIYDSTGRRVSGTSTDSLPGSFSSFEFLPSGTYYVRSYSSAGYIRQLYGGANCPSCPVTSGTPVTVVNGTDTTGIDFNVVLGARIAGRISRVDNGDGLVAVNVQFYDGQGRFATSVNSEANGLYTLPEGLPAGPYFVKTTTAKPFVNKLFPNITCLNCSVTTGTAVVVGLGGTTTSGIDLALALGGDVAGRVTALADGSGIAAVSVEVRDLDGNFLTAGDTTATGSYVSRDALPSGEYQIRTSNAGSYLNFVYGFGPCSGCDSKRGSHVIVAAGQTTSGIDMALTLGGRIRGVVTNNSGSPLSGVNVQAFGSTGSFAAGPNTDSAGNYTTEGLFAGTYFVRTFNSIGYTNQLYQGTTCLNCTVTTGTPVTVVAGQMTSGIDFALVPGSGGYITGRVTDAATGLGVRNVTVEIYDSTIRRVSSGFTGTDGTYITTDILPTGTYFARTFNQEGYVRTLYGGSTCAGCLIASGTPIQVANGGNTTGIDFVIGKGARVTGRITAADTGAGLFGIAVQIFDDQNRQVSNANTTTTGDYLINEALVAGNYYVRTTNARPYINAAYPGVTCINCNAALTGNSIVVGAPGTTTSGVDMALALGAQISGRVTDAATGAGLSLVSVEISNAQGTFVTSSNTDASGNYTQAQALPAGTYYARTNNAGNYQNGLYSGLLRIGNAVTAGTPITATAGATATGIDFALTLGGRISGTVTDPTGAPLVGVNVQVYNNSGTFLISTNTTTGGVYTSEGLSPGTYRVRTNNSLGYVNVLYDGIDCANCSVTIGTPVTVTAAQITSNINLAFKPAAKLSGTVRNVGGSGVGSVNVQAFSVDTGAFVTSTTSAATTGAYQMGLPAGTYFIRTSSSLGLIDQIYKVGETVPCPSSFCLSSGTQLTLANGDATTIDFTLATGGVVAGVVRDAATNSPLPNVAVSVVDDTTRTLTTVTTNASGEYLTRVGLPSGNYYVRTIDQSLLYMDQVYSNASCIGTSCAVSSATFVSVTAGATSTIDFALHKGGRFAGHVTDTSTGLPLGGVSVDVLTLNGAGVSNTTTNSNGEFTTRALPAGDYYLKTSNNNGYINLFSDGSVCIGTCTPTIGAPTKVSLGDGALVTGIDFALQPGGRIAGQITDGATGDGIVAGVAVADALGRNVAFATSDATGHFATGDGLVSGTYFARSLNASGYFDQRFNDLSCAACPPASGSPITVTTGQTTDGIDFALAAGARIRGLVKTTTGRPLSGANVQLLDAGGHGIANGSTNVFGMYTTNAGVPPGTYYARSNVAIFVNEAYPDVDCPSVCSLVGATPVTLAGTSITTGVDFTLDPGARLAGRVTEAGSGNPISFATVVVFDPAGLLVTNVASDADGNYLTTVGLPSGTYYARTNNAEFINQVYPGVQCAGCALTTGTSFSLTAPQTRSNVNFDLTRGGAIAGTVTRAGSGAGIPGVVVRVYDQNLRLASTGQTDASGKYVVRNGGLPSGSYFVATGNPLGLADELYGGIACGAICDIAAGTPVAVAAGSTTGGINFILGTPVAPPAVAPTTLSPSDVTTSTTAAFTWRPVAGAVGYRLVVDDATQAGRIDLEYNLGEVRCLVLGATSCTATPPVSLAAGPAKWRVAAITGAGYGAFSADTEFTVAVGP